MMETLEQQQAKSTPNSEPHAGDTDAPPAASGEDDDYDEHNNAFQLENEEKNESLQSDQELRPKSITSDKNNGLELLIENGRAQEDVDSSSIPEVYPAAVSSTESSPSISCVKIESKATNDAEEISEQSFVMPSDSQESSVDIKIEEKMYDTDGEASPSVSCPATDVKLVEDYLSDDEEKIVTINEETASQDDKGIDKEMPSTDIKIESRSPLVDTLRDDDDLNSSPVITILEPKPTEEKEQMPELNLSSALNGSQNEDDCSVTAEILKQYASEELRISTDIKVEQQIMEEDESSPVYKIDEERGETTSSAAAEAEVETDTSPVYKINDFSPVSIPDDEEDYVDDFVEPVENLPKVENKSPVDVIKIESDSEDDTMQLEAQGELQVEPVPKLECEDYVENITIKLPVEPTLKVKINGAHTPVLLQQNDIEQQDEPEQEQRDIEQMAEKNELSVIASNAEQMQEQEQEKADENFKRRSSSRSRSSSISSTSQQLVIDHPESEQNAKLHQTTEEPLQEHVEIEDEQLKLQASKRRRTGSNSSGNHQIESKQQRLDEDEEGAAATTATTTTSTLVMVTEEQNSASLLLQRLQAPVPNYSETTKLLSCFKCNASNFENLQQLNAHYPQCGQPMEAEAQALDVVATPTPTPPSVVMPKKERFFRCACCSTVHQCWNFFLHMREVHQRYICLYCSHVFASVEKLSLHLENKHDMDQRHFNNVADWQALQTQEDRVRYLVCCNCQASFERGSQFDDHDCAELMQPCALCGLKGSHANGCRNGSSASNRKKAGVRRRRRIVKNKPQQELDHTKTKELQQLPNWLEMEAANRSNASVQHELSQPMVSLVNNIPAPLVEDAPQQDVLPKLVVPKIMLRVPKEFQKSVDAELSSTDSEDEEPDELPSAGTDAILGESNPSTVLTVDAVQQLAISNLSEDTETATETTSTFLETPAMPANMSMDLDEDDDSPTAKLTRMLAEFERTKQDIQRTRAHMMAKKEMQQLQQDQAIVERGVEQQQQQQPQPQEAPQEQTQPRWSPTPPASPHNNHINELTHVLKEQDEQQQQPEESKLLPAPVMQRRDTLGSECMDIDESINEQQSPKLPPSELPHDEPNEQLPEQAMHVQPEEQSQELDVAELPPPPADGIVVAGADTHTLDLQLDRPLDKFEMIDFVRLCLKTVYPFCLYCNHARRIAVNAQKLVLHLIGQHRFTATVDSITAEELHAETIVARLKSYLPALEDHYLNAVSVCSVDNGRFVEPFNERIYECFQCRYVTATHKELYTHNRRLHIKTNITCCMCRLNFFSYSELLCHICPGHSACNVFDVKFRCCLCETAPLPSAFRLMVHMRKQHQTCDICLEDCHTQAKLSAHVWKHKLLHLCYRCGIAYRNKQDISKHLFWKHGTESASCKRCLQKRWRHVYHFCVPAAQFPCDQCQFIFSKAIYLEVHKRQHTGDFRYACTEDGCEEKFVSRKMLLRHATVHEQCRETSPSEEQSQDKNIQQQPELDNGQHEQKQQQSEQLQPQPEEHTKSDEQNESKQQAAAADVDVEPPKTEAALGEQSQPTSRKRRKKNKRNKASLEDLNLIAPNLSESDSSDDSDSDAGRSTGTASQQQQESLTLPMRAVVDDLDMPRVMLSPASESDNESEGGDKEDKEKRTTEEQIKPESGKDEKKLSKDLELENKKEEQEQELKQEEEQKLKQEENAESESVPDIWKNLLQNHSEEIAKTEKETAVVSAEIEPTEEQLRPHKLHVAYSDHDYCKLQQTPPPTPKVSPKKSSHGTPNKAKRAANASSDSDSSSSSSSSDSDSSSCSCGSNCSCSSSGSSSSDDDSDDESPKKKQIENPPERTVSYNNNNEEDVNVTSINAEEEETPRVSTPSPKAPLYNESDFDTAISDTDEEFYDAHPQKMASDLLAQKRLALLLAHTQEQPAGGPGNSSYDIVENSRPSTPSLPEEAAAFADKRERLSKNKKKKRERKSTSKSASQAKLLLPNANEPQAVLPPPPPLQLQQQQQQQQATMLPLPQPPLKFVDSPAVPTMQQLDEFLYTPLTHRPRWHPRISEGSSCSDADGQLKRSKRTRRPNKFYGYTSDDENMSSVLAPPLQVGMQLIKPQPPPQLTWAKEDLPTPPKHQRSSQQSHSHQHSHSHPHSHHLHSNGSSRKRNKRTPQSGGTASGSAKRFGKRAKPQTQTPVKQKQKPLEPKQQLPPIPTLKIRPALLMAASDSSDSSSTDDENAEINVTAVAPVANVAAETLRSVPRQLPNQAMPPGNAVTAAIAPTLPPPTLPPPPPPPPATTAFNQPIPPALLPNPDFATLQYFKANNIRYPIRPPAGARLAREGESVYCYCRCPYDEVSEMIACDGDNCLIEWFHFECVGIMVAPQGKWFCAECRPKYSEGLYPGQLKPK